MTVCVNVSGLSRVGCCCSQAMMRCAHAVPTKLVRARSPLSTEGLTACRSTVSSSFSRASQSASRALLRHERRIASFVERARLLDDHPRDASDLVGQSDSHLVDVHALLQRIEPGPESVACPIQMHQTRPCAVDQQASDIAVAALADPQKGLLAAVECSRGTSPSQAARSRALLNWTPQPTAARSAEAPRGPMPGTVINRRATSSR